MNGTVVVELAALGKRVREGLARFENARVGKITGDRMRCPSVVRPEDGRSGRHVENRGFEREIDDRYRGVTRLSSLFRRGLGLTLGSGDRRRARYCFAFCDHGTLHLGMELASVGERS